MRLQLRAVVAATALALGASGAFAAGKTLIYCSEGSPAGFDPARYTAGTDFDACAETVFNRLVEFERLCSRTLWLSMASHSQGQPLSGFQTNR